MELEPASHLAQRQQLRAAIDPAGSFSGSSVVFSPMNIDLSGYVVTESLVSGIISTSSFSTVLSPDSPLTTLGGTLDLAGYPNSFLLEAGAFLVSANGHTSNVPFFAGTVDGEPFTIEIDDVSLFQFTPADMLFTVAVPEAAISFTV